MAFTDFQSALIIGAGSAGTHLTHAFLEAGLRVTVCDLDEAALDRMKRQIYPHRYGAWDKAISQYIPPDNLPWKEAFILIPPHDICVLATPPATRLETLRLLRWKSPKALFMEKPLCILEHLDEVTTQLNTFNCPLWVNYNHLFSPPFSFFINEIKRMSQHSILRRIDIEWRENMGHILDAHPWLTPKDSYLVRSTQGGGAFYEHSHGVAMACQLIKSLDLNSNRDMPYYQDAMILAKMETAFDEPKGMEDLAWQYDNITEILWSSDQALITISQDFVTEPPRKRITVRGDHWSMIYDFSKRTRDSIYWQFAEQGQGEVHYPKTRAAEFQRSVDCFLHRCRYPKQPYTDTYELAKEVILMLKHSLPEE